MYEAPLVVVKGVVVGEEEVRLGTEWSEGVLAVDPRWSKPVTNHLQPILGELPAVSIHNCLVTQMIQRDKELLNPQGNT